MSLFPLQRFESQWPKSQHAALKGGRSVTNASSSPPSRAERGVCLDFVEYFLALEELLSFLCRTMIVLRYAVYEEISR